MLCSWKRRHLLPGGLLGSQLLFLGDGLALSGESGLGLLGLLLLDEGLLLGVLSLVLVDEFHQHTLVLVHVTLALEVKLVVLVLVDLLGLTVLLEETTKHTHAAHPQDLGRHTSFTSTLPLTNSSVATLTLGGQVLANAITGVDDLRLADDEAVLEQLADGQAGVGLLDLGRLIRVQPDLVDTTPLDGGGKSLLRGHHFRVLL